MNIIFSDEIMPGENVVNMMKEAGELCLKQEGIQPLDVSVSLTFVTDEEIKMLNSIHRNKDSITDVLSFPQYDDLNDLPDEGEVLLGDVVICTNQALIQADEFGHSPERELVYLFVHSIFHLLGYDHMEEAEKEEMREAEEKIMDQIGLNR